jgi:hypothetical protein
VASDVKIAPDDLELFHVTDSVEQAVSILVEAHAASNGSGA